MPLGPLCFEIQRRSAWSSIKTEVSTATAHERYFPCHNGVFVRRYVCKAHFKEPNERLKPASLASLSCMFCAHRSLARVYPVCVNALFGPGMATDQMDDQTLIIPSRPIQGKAVINLQNYIKLETFFMRPTAYRQLYDGDCCAKQMGWLGRAY